MAISKNYHLNYFKNRISTEYFFNYISAMKQKSTSVDVDSSSISIDHLYVTSHFVNETKILFISIKSKGKKELFTQIFNSV